jgi:hypothetical protein
MFAMCMCFVCECEGWLGVVACVCHECLRLWCSMLVEFVKISGCTSPQPPPPEIESDDPVARRRRSRLGSVSFSEHERRVLQVGH